MRKDASVWRNESYLYKRIESFNHVGNEMLRNYK